MYLVTDALTKRIQEVYVTDTTTFEGYVSIFGDKSTYYKLGKDIVETKEEASILAEIMRESKVESLVKERLSLKKEIEKYQKLSFKLYY